MSILDEFNYPWHNPEAQQLHNILVKIHSNSRMAVLAAQQAGINTSFIFTDQALPLVWKEILDAAATQALTRALAQQTRDGLNATNPVRSFLEDLVADRPTQTENEPRNADGAPIFLTGSDDISNDEALLFHDDLMIQIGKVPALITTLQNLVTVAPSVCKLSVDFHGKSGSGTGFRISPDLLLTNWHVLHNRSDDSPASAATAEFGYDDDGKGGALAATPIQCDVNSIKTSKEDDWAVIRSKEALSDSWPIVKLSGAIDPSKGAETYIIQHPLGNRKRLGFVRNLVADFNDRAVHYLTDTQEGSSGSPVFNPAGKLMALHHVGGRPQEIVGKPPVKKNEGIRISRIVEGLKAQGITVP